MHEHACFAFAYGLRDMAIGEYGRQRHVAAGEGFAHAHDVGLDACVFPSKQFACATKACGNFIENQQNVEFIAQTAQFTQVLWVVEKHAARALYDGFDDESGKVVVFGGEEFAHWGDVLRIPRTIKTAAWCGHKMALWQAAAKNVVHACDRVAHRHRIPSIAVVAASDGGNIGFYRPLAAVLVLNRHFQRHFYRHRA